MLDPDGAFRQMMGQRQRTAYRDRLIQVLLIHLGIVLGALGTNRRFHDVDQGCFMRFDTIAECVQFQSGHGDYPRRVAVKPLRLAYCWANSSSAGASSGLSGAL